MPSGKQPIRFGIFEINLETGEIRRGGVRVRIQEQPFQVLTALLEKPGEIVTKEELQDRIWKDDTFVDFDRSLATAINKVRQVLGDSATRPQYVETVAKRGYRFIGLTGQASPAGVADDYAGKLAPGEVGVHGRKLLALQIFAVALGVSLLGTLALLFGPNDDSEKPVRRFSFPVEGIMERSGGTLSPDGEYILYAAQTDGESSLWLRPLGDESARQLAGTEGAIAGFWSPDSSWIGFGTRTEIKRVSIDGGSPITLSSLPDTGGFAFLGGTWSPDDERIVFSSGLQLYEVAARSGQPELLFDSSDSPRPFSFRPHFLPTGSGPAALVYVAATSLTDNWVAVLNLETGESRELGPGSRAVYSQDGYLIHGSTDSTEPGRWAWPFSLETLEPTADSLPISTAGTAATLSRDGTLTYLDQVGGGSSRTLAWRDRTGELLETLGQPQNMAQPALSPDGQRVAVRSNESGNSDIWIHDLIRSTKTRLTFEDVIEAQPAWSPSGREIAYRHIDPGPGDTLMRKSADGTGEAVVLV